MYKTVLIVDDSPTEQMIMVKALNGRGYNIITANSGDEAIEKISSKHPDIVILDVVMPGINGFQVCRQIKQSEETKDVKVVMVTGKDQDSDKFWAKKQGADDYITKPFHPNELINSIDRLMQ